MLPIVQGVRARLHFLLNTTVYSTVVGPANKWGMRVVYSSCSISCPAASTPFLYFAFEDNIVLHRMDWTSFSMLPKLGPYLVHHSNASQQRGAVSGLWT